MDYLASPHKTAKYVTPLDTFIDFQNRKAIVVDGYENAILTLTAVRDIAGMVARAVEYDGEWPKIGGIRGNRVTISQILEIGERVRGVSRHPLIPCNAQNSHSISGRPFTIDKVQLRDLEAGNLEASWALGKRHPSFTEDLADQLAAMLKTVLIGMLVSSAKGAWDVSDAFNRRLPDFEFTGIEDFLTKAWEGKP